MAIGLPVLVRRMHKWLALIVGIQALIWTLTGLYMVAVHIDIIRGHQLVRAPAAAPYDLSELAPPSAILAAESGTSEIRLLRLLGQPVWRAETPKGPRLFDARSGAPLPPLTKAQVQEQARRIFAGEGRIVSARLLTAAPLEMQARTPPFWQVEFEGWNRPTFYLSPTTGELISRRHALWRVFDFAWMLHIMDYDERSDVNNLLLRIVTWSVFAMAMMGAWLLFWSFPRRKRKKT